MKMKIPEYVERMADELIDLEAKLLKAKVFIKTQGDTLYENEYNMLEEQIDIMVEYANKLSDRLNYALRKKFSTTYAKIYVKRRKNAQK